MVSKYQWPASRLTPDEMAILQSWKDQTGLPINECLKQAVTLLDRVLRKNQNTTGEQP